LTILQFIESFFKRKGQVVLLSAFLAKAINFLVSVLVIRIVSQAEYGYIAYGLTIISFLAPFVGAGLHQGLLRYGALSRGQLAKKVLFDMTFQQGLKYTALLAVLMIIMSPVLAIRLPESITYLLLLSFQLIGLFIFQMIQVYCRLIHRNQLFAMIDIQHSILLLIFNVSMCYFFGGMGYVISLICIPLFLGLFYLKKLNLLPLKMSEDLKKHFRESFSFKFKELFGYGLMVSAAGVLAQLLFAIDILLIGNILADPDALAQYKASSIIPFSLLMLSIAVLTTDFVKLASDAVHNKQAIKQYYWNYLKIFSLVSIGILIFFYYGSELLLGLFGKDYQGHGDLMFIFAIGVVGGLLFRVPLGNLLSAIGWPKVNALFSVIVLLINLVANYFMIVRYGIKGAAITTSALMWFSGFLSLGAFLVFLRR